MSELNDDSGLWYSVRGTGNKGSVTIHGDYGDYQRAIASARGIVEKARDISELHQQDVNTIAWVALASAFDGDPYVFEKSAIADHNNK